MTAPFASGDLAADRRYLWAETYRADGDLSAAADLFRQTLELVPHWPPAWFGLGETLAGLGRLEEAAEAFRACLELAPDDILGAGLRLAVLADRSPEMPPAYVAGLFDSYAGRFDTHLIEALNYRGPKLLLQALQGVNAPGHRFGAVADIGCGTGLMGRALAGHADVIDGVDLSTGMLGAVPPGLYRTLAAQDATTFLRNAPGATYDLVVAADVLVYLGALGEVFAAAAHALRPDGQFAFTVQKHAGEGYRLGPDMRFAHARSYIEAEATTAGFTVAALDDASTRDDGGRPVPGLVVVLRRSAGGA